MSHGRLGSDRLLLPRRLLVPRPGGGRRFSRRLPRRVGDRLPRSLLGPRGGRRSPWRTGRRLRRRLQRRAAVARRLGAHDAAAAAPYAAVLVIEVAVPRVLLRGDAHRVDDGRVVPPRRLLVEEVVFAQCGRGGRGRLHDARLGRSTPSLRCVGRGGGRTARRGVGTGTGAVASLLPGRLPVEGTRTKFRLVSLFASRDTPTCEYAWFMVKYSEDWEDTKLRGDLTLKFICFQGKVQEKLTQARTVSVDDLTTRHNVRMF